MYPYSKSPKNFEGDNLQGKNFQDYLDSLENAKFQGANLKGANFQGVNLRGAEFHGVNLRDVNLQSAILRGTKFQGADLRNANLQLADLHEANFKGAKLHGANLKGCVDIKIATWEKAQYDLTTQFPANFNPDDYNLIQSRRKNRYTHEELRKQPPDEIDRKIKSTLIQLGKSIQKRQGQKKFRNDLIRVYQGCCAFTGCSVEEVLEAAHVKPYFISQENQPENGILLRADLHTIFDLNLIVIHPQTKKIEVHKSLQNSIYYRDLDNNVLLATQTKIYSPSEYYLEWRYQNYGKYVECFWKPYL